MERVSCGIKEIDSMIEGGLPKGSIVGISGPPGIGKSLFGLQFILEGARKGEKSVYISLEEPRMNLDKMISGMNFSKEFYEFEKKGLIVIRCFHYFEYEKLDEDLLKKIQEDNLIKRVVVDSFNCFFDTIVSSEMKESFFIIRKKIHYSFSFLRREDLNVLLVLEKSENSSIDSLYNIPYFVDGIFRLNYLDFGILERRLFIPKMRWTNQCKESRGYDISSEGLVLNKK